MTLMYAYGASSVSCASCHFVTQIVERENRNTTMRPESVGASGNGNDVAPSRNNTMTTVVVQNPDTLDDNGQLVHNIAVGITSDDKARMPT